MSERTPEQKERLQPRIVACPPATELLASPEQAPMYWPTELATNPEFLRQLDEHKELNNAFEAILSRLPQPDITLEEALVQKHITPEHAARLLSDLTHFFDQDPLNARLVLYFPFELIPNPTTSVSTPSLEQAITEFRAAYVRAWSQMLGSHDVRANFVDGDVLEPWMSDEDPERVVKAAHLTPQLIEKKLIRLDDVIDELNETTDEVLAKSFAETLPVLAQKKLITPEDLERITRSEKEIKDLIELSKQPWQSDAPDEQPSISASDLFETMHRTLQEADSTSYEHMTMRRETWLRTQAHKHIIDRTSEQLALLLDQLTPKEIIDQLLLTDANAQHALIQAIEQHLEQLVRRSNTSQAQSFWSALEQTILHIWDTSPNRHQPIEQLLYRLHVLHVVSDQTLHTKGLKRPALGGPFSENAKHMETELKGLRSFLLEIKQDPHLKEQVFPVVMMSGSRLKGYGSATSDIDVTLCVRTQSATQELLDLLQQRLVTHLPQGDLLLFQLTEQNGQLRIENGPSTTTHVGWSEAVHLLFGSVWEGEASDIQALRTQLLTPYFYDQPDQDKDFRRRALQELERSTLQYRLLHHGHAKFHPFFGDESLRHYASIDGTSEFWNSGYRTTATKLYLNQVFLPHLEQK